MLAEDTRLVIHDNEMAENIAPMIHKRHARKTFRAQCDQVFVLGKQQLEPFRIRTNVSFYNAFAGRAAQGIFYIVGETGTVPKSERAYSGLSRIGAFSDEGIANP